MKRMELFDELTYIDDDLILDAHEIPVHRQYHFDSRRFGVLLSAVIAVVVMSVAVVATMTEDMDFRLQKLWNEMVKGGYTGYYTYDENHRYELLHDTAELDEHQVEINLVHVYNLNYAELRISCEGKTLQVKLEAMVLMGDGRVKYKSRTVQGDDEVTVTLDNLIAGEPGTIVHLRRTISLLGETGWKILPPINSYIANDFDCRIPIGTDLRFPDTKLENYRWWETFHYSESDRAVAYEVFHPGKNDLIAAIK